MQSGQNLKLTNQRKIILEELRNVRSHPTADMIYEMVKKRLPRISLGTVYRNLEVLSENGFIKKMETCGSQKRFDGNTMEHYHVRCDCCGRITDIYINEHVNFNFNEIGNLNANYQVTGYRLEFMGICSQCRDVV